MGKFILSLFCICLLIYSCERGIYKNDTSQQETVLTFDFPFFQKLPFDPKIELDVKVSYHATKPDEEGVFKVSNKNTCQPKAPIIICSTGYGLDRAVDIVKKVYSYKIQLNSPNQFSILINETIPGPGKYELYEIRLGFSKTMQNKYLMNNWNLFFKRTTQKMESKISIPFEKKQEINVIYLGSNLILESRN